MPYLNSAHSPTGPGPSPYTPDTTPGSTFGPSAIQKQQNGNVGEPHGNNRGSGDYDESRRSSVTGSIHQGMQHLGLGPTSPYHSNNQSQTSIVSGLQQQRGIPTGNGYNNSRYSTMSGGPLSPYSSQRNSRGPLAAGRVAPPILENPKADVYSAEAPTRGQAYAFPDPDGSRTSLSGRPPSTFSRRNSFAESFTSSIMTMESTRLPRGQHELPEAHHHSLTNKQIDTLRDDPDSPNSTTPYSRTPELRVTHKLAERKRRSEMKDCFEQLRTRLPAGQNNKSSKWETLSRAIDYINSLESSVKQQRIDAEKQHRQMQEMEMKMQQMNEQLQRMQHQGSFPAPPNTIPQSPYGSHYPNGMDGANEQPRTLPPLMNGAMQGVQFSDDRR
ncbi:uncharacterized protein HMPREF1541_08225 [Cyphellophora europaea CBS 101466]|uniref:BHLH domain-containing protein n=1 Tax=Cyphellophora europaea (strain CBS 101466) TaxID=1220924 RepID=W2RLN7_CYPE1|nr:uncharacterized protein HMPREF1541_08225 [Cyphellophora europaea CBS 101466]ETN37235.1 hypothetical protein HMPREF1541_08225 [Cyphellophora europaea CBS 101466]